MPTDDTEPATPPRPAPIPYRYSKEELALLTATLARPEVNGDLSTASMILSEENPAGQWTLARVRAMVKSNDYLQANTGLLDPSRSALSDKDAINRENILTPSERSELNSLRMQNKTLEKQDWQALGVSEKQAGRMMSMERFARLPLKSIVNTTHGSMIYSLGVLLEKFEEIADRLQRSDLPEELDREGNPRPKIDIERDYHKVLLEYSREIRAIKSETDRGVMLAAKVAQMQSDGGKGKKKGRPGFAPMNVTPIEPAEKPAP